MKRPTVRRANVPISDIAEQAINELLPYFRMGTLSDHGARRKLLKNVIEEGLYALADHVEQNRSVRMGIRFDVSATGERRGYARERAAEQIDTLLSEARELDV